MPHTNTSYSQILCVGLFEPPIAFDDPANCCTLAFSIFCFKIPKSLFLPFPSPNSRSKPSVLSPNIDRTELILAESRKAVLTPKRLSPMVCELMRSTHQRKGKEKRKTKKGEK